MRGLNRLANAADALTTRLDEIGDKLAERFTQAGERADAAVGTMINYATEVEEVVVNLEKTAQRLTNNPLSGSGKE